ncbi:MAG: DegT/DnrJ/EryC1/StrS aminotransferase family protein [Nitrospirae bacterium]|nr:MAG: DegT/DnrJ/EryC1/StrS aminotransferase family protein [Nitrospirota bacterium]
MANSSALNPRKEFLPFSLPTIGQEEIDEVVESLRSGWLTTGPKVIKFQEKFKSYIGCRNAVALNSGTAGLHVALLSMDLRPGDEVITTPLTFTATANTILHAGGRVVFADIDMDTLNVDIDAVKAAITPSTKAVIPVHFAGLPCDMDAFIAYCRRKGILIIEDAAHAVGSEYKGIKIGSIGDITVFSFHPTKGMTTGEGGMITFSDDGLKDRFELLGFHGIERSVGAVRSVPSVADYDIKMPGFKYNMLDIQAAIGLHQIDRLNAFIKKRTLLAELYRERLERIEELILPKLPAYDLVHSWHIFTPLLKIEDLNIDRHSFISELRGHGIGAAYHYKALHLHSFYRTLGFRPGQFPKAEYVSDRILSLPLFPNMTERDIDDVSLAVENIIAKNRKKGF